VGRIRTLIIGAGIAFVVSALLDSSSQPGGGGIDFDGLLTMGFLVYIWYTLRWATSSKRRQDPTEKLGESDPQDDPSRQDKREQDSLPTADEPYIVHIQKKISQHLAEQSPADESASDQSAQNLPDQTAKDHIPNILGSLRGEAIKIIYHKSPWAIIERGATIGRFQNAPIPAWIRTSDNRAADYNGIAEDPSLDGTVCIEIPERSELILPPGLVYILRS
jgi:hypothetical protein